MMDALVPERPHGKGRERETIESAVVRFAGDSGDGMQVTGGQFTLATALSGNDLATFPDFPAEIRAPVGTTFGVSSFQINFGARVVRTAGDQLDVLVAMNPAALIVNIGDVKPNGLIIVDENGFTERDIAKAGYTQNPLEDGSLDAYRVMRLPISDYTMSAVKSVEDANVSNKESLRSKNMWALGLILWLFERDKAPVAEWIGKKFAKLPDIARINTAALDAGFIYGDVTELAPEIHPYRVPPAAIPPGEYRNINGSEAVSWGLVAGAHLAQLNLAFCSYPITPASNMLHILTKLGKEFNVATFQAEDEIAAVCAAIGASYAGELGVTGSSGPGIALKTEAICLAAATELPLVIVNAQRGGPSTGLPTKTEQSDLYQAVWGRNGDTPLAVIAARSPGDCFDAAIEACRLAVKYMTPVILLTDGYLSNASEPWLIPDFSTYEPFPASHAVPENFQPYTRDPETLSRPWVVPGTPGGIHRIGGIERKDGSGEISYDAANHQIMTDYRERKIAGIANDIPDQEVVLGPESGPLAVVGWGSTYGPVNRAVDALIEQGINASHIHLRHIWPLPKNLGELLSGFEHILVPEMNTGQLATLLRSEYLCELKSLPKVSGRPFQVAEIVAAARELVEG